MINIYTSFACKYDIWSQVSDHQLHLTLKQRCKHHLHPLSWVSRHERKEKKSAFSYHHVIYSEKQPPWVQTSPADSTATSEEAGEWTSKPHANFPRTAVWKSTSYDCRALTILPNAVTRNPNHETCYRCDAAKSLPHCSSWAEESIQYYRHQ